MTVSALISVCPVATIWAWIVGLDPGYLLLSLRHRLLLKPLRAGFIAARQRTLAIWPFFARGARAFHLLRATPTAFSLRQHAACHILYMSAAADML